jgi:hypothetical protein
VVMGHVCFSAASRSVLQTPTNPPPPYASGIFGAPAPGASLHICVYALRLRLLEVGEDGMTCQDVPNFMCDGGWSCVLLVTCEMLHVPVLIHKQQHERRWLSFVHKPKCSTCCVKDSFCPSCSLLCSCTVHCRRHVYPGVRVWVQPELHYLWRHQRLWYGFEPLQTPYRVQGRGHGCWLALRSRWVTMSWELTLRLGLRPGPALG